MFIKYGIPLVLFTISFFIAHPSSARPITNPLLGKQHLESPFTFHLTCTSKEENCDHVRRNLESAGIKIGQLLMITTSIQVQVEYFSFLESTRNSIICAPKGTLGTGRPSSYYIARSKETKQWIKYPSALAIQLLKPSQIKSGNNIILQLNSDSEFFFGDSDKKIEPTEHDIEAVIVHELAHGLGILSNWQVIDEESVLIPGFVENDKSISWYATFTYLYIRSPPSLFSSMMRNAQGIPLTHYFGSLPKLKSKTRHDAIIELQKSPSWEQFKEAYTGRDRIFIKLKDSTLIKISNHPLNHIDISYKSSDDFLMVSESPIGVCLGSRMHENVLRQKNRYVYGPLLTGIFSEMGYRTVKDKTYKDIELELSSLSVTAEIKNSFSCALKKTGKILKVVAKAVNFD